MRQGHEFTNSERVRESRERASLQGLLLLSWQRFSFLALLQFAARLVDEGAKIQHFSLCACHAAALPQLPHPLTDRQQRQTQQESLLSLSLSHALSLSHLPPPNLVVDSELGSLLELAAATAAESLFEQFVG